MTYFSLITFTILGKLNCSKVLYSYSETLITFSLLTLLQTMFIKYIISFTFLDLLMRDNNHSDEIFDELCIPILRDIIYDDFHSCYDNEQPHSLE